MSMLFAEGMAGYRLESFEFYNWGCFDGKIWKISPRGHSSLLTGANGSGKTTLVDALVTLLVPPGRRHYNQSSGADKKRERTEASYVQGAVGSQRREESLVAVPEYLRTKSEYSLLVGVFRNRWLNKELSLGQIRWFTTAGLKKLYFTAPRTLTLKQNLLPVDFQGNFRKDWKEKYNVTFYDSFSLYVKRFLPILGLKSEKGLNLFSHIVGVKVLGNLNEFIRTNMLDAPDMEEEFTKLHNNYQQLFNSHRKIELADKQLELLEPVMKSITKVEGLKEKVREATEMTTLLPGYFARKISDRLGLEIQQQEEELRQGREKRDALELEREARDRERRDLEAAIDRNEATQRIRSIENEMVLVEAAKARKLTSYNRYAGLAENLGLAKLKEEEDFSFNKQKGAAREQELRVKEQHIDEHLFKTRDYINRQEEQGHSLEEDLESLRNRRNNIPRQNIDIRRRIAQALKLPDEQLPFAGELIRVKENEAEWELAAERLLHNFALCLLVSEEHYTRVNYFVNKNDLRGRLIYFKVTVSLQWSYQRDLNPASLIYKLEPRKDSPFFSWVDHYIHNHFDYICVEKVEEFAHQKRAVTREGLIKSGERHEKDDRTSGTGRKHFVLGWDNRGKIAYLTRQLREVREAIAEKQTAFAGFKKQAESLEQEKGILLRFQEFQSFRELSWWEEEGKLKQLREEKERLASASRELKELHRQFENVKAVIKQIFIDISAIDRRIGQVEQSLKGLKHEAQQYALLLEAFEGIVFAEKRFVPFMPAGTSLLSHRELIALRDRALGQATEELKKCELRYNTGETTMVKLMQVFKSPGAEILKTYPGWESFTLELDASEKSSEDYRRVYASIKKDDLPKYKKEFKEFLNDKMLEDLIDFRQSLDQGEKDIIANITELNSALQEIEYNKSPSTYIILHYEKSRDQMVMNFRSRLKSILGDAFQAANRDEAFLENLFKRMQKFILDIREDDYKRKKVLNVRNWLRFSAVEKYKEDDAQKQFYEDSQSLSGGEKAKLAYTILASAIAYQFNIAGSTDEERSFRFAIVDEAFSKVDPENSLYAMELFKKLQLQLMVVTPLDKINIVEDYIQAVHFVENNGRSSTLYNLTLEEYKARKEELAAAGAEV